MSLHLQGTWLQLEFQLAEVDLLWQPSQGNFLHGGKEVHLASDPPPHKTSRWGQLLAQDTPPLKKKKDFDLGKLQASFSVPLLTGFW